MIIGLGHHARVGKDTAGKILVTGWGFEHLSFAARLKSVALATNPIITGEFRLKDVVERFGWDDAKHRFPEVRLFLQHLGVACRAHISENVWIDLIDRQVADLNKNFVITDVRFKNEANRLAGFPGGFVVNVTRPGYGPESDHVSETELDRFPFDYTLRNDGTIGDLGHAITVMIAKLATKGE